MININMNKEGIAVSISGDLSTLCADTVMIVRSIYHAISEKSENVAEGYMRMMSDDLCRLAFTDEETIRNEAGKAAIKMLIEMLTKAVNGDDDED